MIAITGPTSGIGKACAEIFAQNALDLLLIGRNREKLENLKKQLFEDNPSKKFEVFLITLDLMDNSKIKEVFHNHREIFKKVNCFINNAGVAKGLAPTHLLENSDIEQMIQTNLTSLILLSKEISKIFIENNQGHIINIGSIAGLHIYPNGNVYCATKHAVKAMTQALRVDLNGYNIRVSEVSPGMVNTNFSKVRLGDQKKADEVYQNMSPLLAQDIAETVYWIFNRPAHVNIQDIVIYPTDQASPTIVNRS